MINYDTPKKIGIGLTRGSACCITSKDNSEEKTLDYSGRLLNLASRLMDLARPSGIVLDYSFGMDLLEDETKEMFAEDKAYVRGVAEEEPIKIYYTKQYTLLPPSCKKPLKEPTWHTDPPNRVTLAELKKIPPNELKLNLSKKPLDENKITVRFSHPSSRLKGGTTSFDYTIEADEIRFDRVGTKYAVIAKADAISKHLEEEGGATDDMTIEIEVVYPVE